MSKEGVGGRFKANEGDWVCGDQKCGNVNFARRTECNKCGASKNQIIKKDGSVIKKGGSEIGKTMAEKSKGLFSADDWQCKSCGNVNWARRMTCNVCNTPKYGKLEQRTGYGGGYMERDEVVEYKEKTGDDDEGDYDEFGRLKKGKRGKIVPVPSIITYKPPDDDDDDDEDDDEDGDVSKYKLESDDEDDEDADLSKYALSDDSGSDTKPNSKTKSKKSSRSRSSSSSSSSSSRSRSRSSSSRSRSRRRSYSRSRSRSVERSDKRRRRRSSSYSRSRSRSPKSRRRSSGSGSRSRRSRS